MKKEINLFVTRKEYSKVEVEFPLYRKQEATTYNRGQTANTCYERVTDDGVSTIIHYQNAARNDLTKESYQITVRTNVEYSGTDSDYVLGMGEYACTAEEFNQTLRKAIDFAQAQLAPKEESGIQRTYTREEVQKWRDDIAIAAAEMVERASASFGSGDWSWLFNGIRQLSK
jgi:hypothetical protein